MRFAANLSHLFVELPLIERFGAAKAAGFAAVEINFPYDHPAQEMRRELVRHDLGFTQMCCPPPNWTGGARGFAAVPGAEARFRRDFERALRYAEVLRAAHVTILPGRARGAVARATLVENLRFAAAAAPGRSLLLEPLCAAEMPGWFLDSFWSAAEILEEVGAPNLGLLFDAFHAQMMSEDLMATWAAHAPRVRHVQIAAAPDRSEPDAGAGGETGGPGSGGGGGGGGGPDWGAFLEAVAAAGLRGPVGAEYIPRRTTAEGLGWLARYL